MNAPPAKRPAIAEFITRANYGLPNGNFEMDFEDGEIRFKTSMDTEDIELTDAMVRNLVYANVLAMDQYLPGIMNVIYSDMSPDAAINRIENTDDSSSPAEAVTTEGAVS